MARPAIALERLGRDGDGLVVYELKRPFRDGTTHVLFEPLDFIARLAALVPRPRSHLIRFHGLFAPNARHRRLVARTPPPAPVSEGGLRQARDLISRQTVRPDVVVARRLSPGAREAPSAAGIGWVDETGAAEIALGSLIVSRSGRPIDAPRKPARWRPSVLAGAEALLCGGKATVASMQETTGLSAGGCTNALRALTELGLLTAAVRRGRASARQVPDSDQLLDQYATAAAAMKAATTLAVGVTWRDPVAGLGEAGRLWESAGIAWAATGTVAAAVLAPYLTTVSAGEAYVDTQTIAGLESVAATADLRPIEGGRLTLRPFPTVTARVLAEMKDGLCLAP